MRRRPPLTGPTRPLAAPGGIPPNVEPTPLPAHLVDDLVELFAQALVADRRAHPNLAALHAINGATVVPPPGTVRSARPEGPQATNEGRRRPLKPSRRPA